MADDSWVGVADLHTDGADQESLVDKAANWLNKGVPLAVASGVTSIMNTGISLGNFLGGESEKIDFGNEVRGYDDDLAKYYEEHQAGIDLGGFVATSLVPGTLGMKGLKVLQALKDGDGIGRNVGVVAGYFAAKQEKYLEAAAKTITSPTQQIWAGINRDKILAMTAGVGESALEGAAFEAGVLLTMNQNPVMEPDERDNYVQSLWRHIPQSLENAGLFGVIGGAIGAAGVTGKINKLIRVEDEKQFPSLFAYKPGDTDLPAGTLYSHFNSTLEDLRDTYKQMQEIVGAPKEGEAIVNEKALINQTATIKNFEGELKLWLQKKLVNQDTPEIGKAINDALEKIVPGVENNYTISQRELIARTLGGADKINRIQAGVSGMVDKYIGLNPAKVMDAITGIDTATVQVTKELEHAPFYVGKKGRIVNLTTGEITREAYPRASDIGVSEIRKGDIYTGDQVVKTPEKFDTLANSPTESNNQFWIAHNEFKNLGTEEVPMEISVNNIPQLEAAVISKVNPDTIRLLNYPGISSDLGQVLQDVKISAASDLMAAGKDLNYISRALNVPKKFLTDLEGPVTLGSLTDETIENFTKPVYVEIEYTGSRQMNKFMAEGMQKVDQELAISTTQRINVAAKIFGSDFNNLPKPTGRLEGVGNISGAPGLFTSADAARGSTQMAAMQVGKFVDKYAKQTATDIQNAIYPMRQEIISDPAKLYKRNINAGKLRASDEDMVSLPDELHPGGQPTHLILLPKSIVDTALEHAETTDPIAWIQNFLTKAPTQAVIEELGSSEARYLIARQAETSKLAEQWNASNAARGKTTKINPQAFYEPPIDTTRQPYFALVSENNPLDDLRPQSMIVAQSAAELEAKVAQIEKAFGDRLKVYKKDDIKLNKQLDASYDSGMLFGKTAVDSALKREGILSDFIPRKDGYIFQEEDQWIWRQSQAMARNGVELMYGSELSELRFLRDNWNKANSRFADSGADQAANPYNQVINTFLNLSNRSNYAGFWGKINEGAQAAYTAMTDAYVSGFKAAQDGVLSFEEAEKIARQAGYNAPFGKVAEDVFRETFKDNNSLSKIVSKVNMAASTLMIRMDPLNSLINVMSLPVLLASESSAVRKEVQEAIGLSVTVPGTAHQIPSTMRLLMDGTKSYWSKEPSPFNSSQTLKDWFKSIGAIRTDIQLIQDQLAIPISSTTSTSGALAYSNQLAKTVGEFGAKWSGNDLAEEFVRYQAAYAGLQLAKAQGITSVGELAAYVNLTVNRVHGNYLASQRPTIFSGPVGQAIGLFQTYQFNMIQQMTRYLQEGNYKSVAIAAGMQNSIFGLQGSPLFWQLNKYIGDSNRDHGDIVTGLGNTVGTGGGFDDPAKWLLYGLGANSLQVNLYNRGDLTPRFTTILPTSFQDIPAISIGTKAIGSFLDSMKAIGNGAPVADSILQGVAHAGFNRPLAGLATLVSGKKTTGSGSLLAAYNDLDSMTVAAKIAGGEPLNNAIAIDSYYRLQQYKTDEAKRMAELGDAVKLTVAGTSGGLDSSKTGEFMTRYAEAGGDIKNFNRFMIHQTKNANQSVVDQMKQQMRNPLAQKQLGWLGAEMPKNLETAGTIAE